MHLCLALAFLDLRRAGVRRASVCDCGIDYVPSNELHAAHVEPIYVGTYSDMKYATHDTESIELSFDADTQMRS